MLEYKIESTEDHFPELVKFVIKSFENGDLLEDRIQFNVRPMYTTWVLDGKIIRTIHYKEERKGFFETAKEKWGIDLVRDVA